MQVESSGGVSMSVQRQQDTATSYMGICSVIALCPCAYLPIPFAALFAHHGSPALLTHMLLVCLPGDCNHTYELSQIVAFQHKC